MEFVIVTKDTHEKYSVLNELLHRIANLQHYKIDYLIYTYRNGKRVKYSIDPKDKLFA